MKVVISNKFGGFGLSHAATMRYAELKGITLYPWLDEITKKVYGERATLDNPTVCIHYTTVPEEEYERLQAIDMGKPVKAGRFHDSGSVYFSCRELERTDPLLIKVVEELGDKANSRFSNLVIVEIPDDVEYDIEEYDGNEHIAESHRTWR